MPKCEKCSSHPEMAVSARRDLVRLPGSSAGRMGQSYQMRSHGHPLMATLMSAASGLAWVANKFFEEVEYKCPYCGDTKTETHGT